MQAITTRVKLVNGDPELPQVTKDAMEQIDLAFADFANKLEAVVKTPELKMDVGRIINAVDTLLEMKNVIHVGLKLPHHQ